MPDVISEEQSSNQQADSMDFVSQALSGNHLSNELEEKEEDRNDTDPSKEEKNVNQIDKRKSNDD